MTRITRILLIGAGVSCAIVLAAVAATIVLAAIIIHIATRALGVLFAPRNVHVFGGDRRHPFWYGLRIRVGSRVVLGPDADRVYARDVSPPSALLIEPATVLENRASSGYAQPKQDADVDRDELK
jgi:hypothetical protein